MLPALLVLLFVGAPETDAAELLKVAYASQYEWKEDGLKNITLEFTYTWAWGPKASPKDKEAPPRTTLRGVGRIVVVGQRVVPGHYPDLYPDSSWPRGGRQVNGTELRREFEGHMAWVLRRFVRRPFDAIFKDAKFQGPEKTAFGQKISVNGRSFYVRQDKIAATEKDVSPPRQKPHMVLVQYEHGTLGGGYGILGEKCNYTARRSKMPVAWTRKLSTKASERAPVPLSYAYTRAEGQSEETLQIEFDRVTVDAAHPVVLDPVARDFLKAAWERRFTLPMEMGIEGEFHRRPDKDLARSRWQDVRGTFEVWAMKEIKVAVPEKQFRDPKWRKATEDACGKHIGWIFRTLKPTPFEAEFKDCGFELVPQGAEQVIQVYGYPNALAFRIDGDAIAGHYSSVGGNKGWWSYKLKRTSDDKFMLDRMKREFEHRKIDLRFRYGRVRGFQLPKKVEVFQTIGREPYVATAEYSFRKLKVLLPEKKG